MPVEVVKVAVSVVAALVSVAPADCTSCGVDGVPEMTVSVIVVVWVAEVPVPVTVTG